MNKIKNAIRLVGVILLMPLIIMSVVIASYNCDDYEWDGTGYED